MRWLRYIMLLGILLLGFTFACLNATPISFNYYVGTATLPLSSLFVITLVGGILLGLLIALGWILRLKSKVYRYRQRIKRYKQLSVEFNYQNRKTLSGENNLII